MYRIKFFGGFRLFDASGKEFSFPAWSASGIIAMLCLRNGRQMSREELAENLWANHDSDQKLVNLRQAISRIRKSLPDNKLIKITRDTVGLYEGSFKSDFDELRVLYEQYLMDSEGESGIESLNQYWQIIRQPLFAGWNAATFISLAQQYEMRAEEVGCELAERYQSLTKHEAAKRVLEEILQVNPTSITALNLLLKLENTHRGSVHALAVADQALTRFDVDQFQDLPVELKKTILAIKSNSRESVLQTDFLHKRSEILLLVRLFETNLKAGGAESLKLLESGLYSSLSYSHPRTMHQLLEVALNNTSVSNETVWKIGLQSVHLASSTCNYEMAHSRADSLLSDPSLSPIYRLRLCVNKGFVYFEQRNWARADEWLQKGLELINSTDDELAFALGIITWGTPQYHRGAFDLATQAYDRAYTVCESPNLSPDNRARIRRLVCTNKIYIAMSLHNWESVEALHNEAEGCTEAKIVFNSSPRVNLAVARTMMNAAHFDPQPMIAGLEETLQQGLKRFHQIALEICCVALAERGDLKNAQTIVDSVFVQREAIRHSRSFAENKLLQAIPELRTDAPTGERLNSVYLRQSPAAITQLMVESLRNVAD